MGANACLMLKTMSALASSLDEQKAIADNEAKERIALLDKFRNMEHSADGLQENFNKEVTDKEVEGDIAALTRRIMLMEEETKMASDNEQKLDDRKDSKGGHQSEKKGREN